jgi:hypothetical protein
MCERHTQWEAIHCMCNTIVVDVHRPEFLRDAVWAIPGHPGSCWPVEGGERVPGTYVVLRVRAVRGTPSFVRVRDGICDLLFRVFQY